MNLFKCLIIFSLFHHLVICFAAAPCPETFNCGNIEALEFPLAMEPECGLFLVNGCDPGENPRIQFDAGYRWYDLWQKQSTNRFVIRDPVLQSHLEEESCEAFEVQSLPKSPYASFSISPSATFVKCFNETFDEDIQRRFGNYNSLACLSFDVYYAYSDQHIPRESSAIPSGCVAVELPVGQHGLLTSEYTIEWNVSEDCHDCHRRNGQCLTDNGKQFLCRRRVAGETNFQQTNFKPLLLIVIPAVGVFVATIILILLLIVYRKKQRVLLRFLRLQKAETKNEKDIELFLRNHGNLAQKRFKYSDLKKMTKSFRDNLGKGGFGSVYKGELPDGRLVAVKILNESKENGEDFMNEVASISRTSHVNIVSLVGFCFEGSKRALVYDFMPNGSLDKFIPGEGTSVSSLSAEVRLKWEKLFEIAIGIARGLEYLHQGCITRILHFDIKPHNILLDENFNPKISDFGLARLCPNRSSIVSMLVARGTIGYIAPEVFCRNFGEVSHRSDVYSYGMMVLEMAVGRQQNNIDRSSEAYFPDWIFADLETNTLKGPHSIVKEGDHEYQFAKKMIIVGLWCIQTEPRNRPSMGNVIEMLEGSVESLQIPPKPFLSSQPLQVAIAALTTDEQSTLQLVISSPNQREKS